MITELVAKELAKLAAQKLSEVKMEDAVGAIKTLRTAALGATLVPGVGVFAGVFSVGLLVGAGAGLLIAPRSGRATREALRDGARQRIAALRAKLGAADPVVPGEAEVREASVANDPSGSQAN
jgi:hypothetical protein